MPFFYLFLSLLRLHTVVPATKSNPWEDFHISSLLQFVRFCGKSFHCSSSQGVWHDPYNLFPPTASWLLTHCRRLHWGRPRHHIVQISPEGWGGEGPGSGDETPCSLSEVWWAWYGTSWMVGDIGVNSHVHWWQDGCKEVGQVTPCRFNNRSQNSSYWDNMAQYWFVVLLRMRGKNTVA